jgi:glycosyltransferase involved in cell wall biosynthesis
MRLNWFSPVPPARTDIGHYTARVLPELSALAEVTLWTDQAEWSPDLERHARVRQFVPDRLSWKEMNRADATFYNIGNNCEFHLNIWHVARCFPGVVVLHDVRVHEMFAYLYRWMRGDHDGYLKMLEGLYGSGARVDGEAWWAGQLAMAEMVDRYPLTPLATDDALGVVVHTPEARDVVRAQGFGGPVACAPLPYPTPQNRPAPPRAGPPYQLIVFGYIHHNRRLESVLKALASLPEKDQFVLRIYGELWDPQYVRLRIEALKLGDRVTIHGFVPEPELDAALASSHLAFNLRFPTMGEASGSQLRIWSHALPSLVTPVGMYARLPADAVGFVRPEPEHEVADIHVHLRRLLADPAGFAAMGRAGHGALVADHGPARYARTLVEMAERVAAVRAGGVALKLAERVGAELGRWAEPRAPVARRAAEQIHGLLCDGLRPAGRAVAAKANGIPVKSAGRTRFLSASPINA